LLFDGVALRSPIAIGADLEALNILIKTVDTSLLERELDLMGYELEEKIASECLKCGKVV
jgi:hypothetical protein